MSSLLAGKVLLFIDLYDYVGSPTSLALHAHAQFHPSTTLLPSRDFPIQALLFPNSTSISFFIPPIFVLLNDCDKEQKKETPRGSLVYKEFKKIGESMIINMAWM